MRALLLLLLFVGATPHLLVDISLEQPAIVDYEHTLAEEQRSVYGDWMLVAKEGDVTVFETRFDGVEVDLWGEEEPLQRVLVSIPVTPAVSSLELYSDGELVDTQAITAVCGDAFCGTGEERTCPADCSVAVEESILLEEYEVALEAESGFSGMQIGLMISCGLLIVVLVLVLVVVNRKKKPPVTLETREY